MPLTITITDAGRAELINAQNTGTTSVEITHVALGNAGYDPAPTQTTLLNEVTRVSSIAGEVVAADTISVTARDESDTAYTVREFGLITEHGTLFAIYSQADPIIEKAMPSTLLLTIDVVLQDLDVTHLTFGDISFSNPPASESVAGVVRFAEQAEVNNGNVDNKVISPETLASRTATTSRTGLIQIASQAQADEGKDLTRALTPGHARATSDARYLRREQDLSDLANVSRARTNLGLTTAATLPVMTNAIDSTIGRLVRIVSNEGFFGLGQTRSPVATDCNKVNANGFYRLGSSTPNAWPNQTSGDGLIQLSWDSDYRHQIGISRAGSGSLWWRSSSNGAWATWQQAPSTGITITAGDGLAGGGNLGANRTLKVDSSVVRTSRAISTGNGLKGGGNLATNRTLEVQFDTGKWIDDKQGKPRLYFGSTTSDIHVRLRASKTGSPKFQLCNSSNSVKFEINMATGRITIGDVPWSLLSGHVAVNSGDGLTGGGSLSATRTLKVDSSVVRTSRAVHTGSGLTGGGNLSANRTLSVKSKGIVAGHLATGTNEANWVRARIATSGIGTTGTYVVAYRTGATTPGSTYSGSSLSHPNGTKLSGTWRCMGIFFSSLSKNVGSNIEGDLRDFGLFLRIS